MNDGGPAFPFETSKNPGANQQVHMGMTLRDYFAAKAMQAEMITSFSDATPESAKDFVEAANKVGHSMEKHLAFNAYSIADAMLAQRAKAKP